MQIWKSVNIFLLYENNMLKDVTLKRLLLFEKRARGICEKFLYQHSETIEYMLKIILLFKKFTNFMSK